MEELPTISPLRNDDSESDEIIGGISASFVENVQSAESFEGCVHDDWTITMTGQELKNLYATPEKYLEHFGCAYESDKREPHIYNETINEIISADEIFRGKNGQGVGWPLLDEYVLFQYMIHYRRSKFMGDMPFVDFERVATQDTDRLFRNKSQIHNPEVLKKYIAFRYPIFDTVLLLGGGNLVLAGGAVTQLLHNTRNLNFHYGWSNIKDFDFFFVGFHPEETERATSLLESIIEALEYRVRDQIEEYPEIFSEAFFEYFAVSRSENVVNVKFSWMYGIDKNGYRPDIETVDLQFILRLYPETGNPLTNISLVIGGFDLYSCAAAYYICPGEEEAKFYATPAGAFAMAANVNILNTGRNSPSMISRLIKYRGRKFRILLPSTSVEKVRSHSRHNMLNLRQGRPYLQVNLPFAKLGFTRTGSPADPDPDYGHQAVNGFVTVPNIHSLLSNHPQNYLVTGSSWRRINGDLKRRILDGKTLDSYMNKVRRQHSFSDTSEMNAHHRSVKLLFTPLLIKEGLSDEEIEERITDIMVMSMAQFNDLCSDLFDSLLEILVEKEENQFVKLREGIKWNTVNPMTQHTASFNPTITDARSWWGEKNYVPFRVGFPDEMYFVLKILFTNGEYGFVGNGVFRNLLMPYFARAWATGICDKYIAPAQIHYRDNVQRFYADKANEAIKKSWGQENFSYIDSEEIMVSSCIPALLNQGDQRIKMVRLSDSENTRRSNKNQCACCGGDCVGGPVALPTVPGMMLPVMSPLGAALSDFGDIIGGFQLPEDFDESGL